MSETGILWIIIYSGLAYVIHLDRKIAELKGELERAHYRATNQRRET